MQIRSQIPRRGTHYSKRSFLPDGPGSFKRTFSPGRACRNNNDKRVRITVICLPCDKRIRTSYSHNIGTLRIRICNERIRSKVRCAQRNLYVVPDCFYNVTRFHTETWTRLPQTSINTNTIFVLNYDLNCFPCSRFGNLCNDREAVSLDRTIATTNSQATVPTNYTSHHYVRTRFKRTFGFVCIPSVAGSVIEKALETASGGPRHRSYAACRNRRAAARNRFTAPEDARLERVWRVLGSPARGVGVAGAGNNTRTRANTYTFRRRTIKRAATCIPSPRTSGAAGGSRSDVHARAHSRLPSPPPITPSHTGTHARRRPDAHVRAPRISVCTVRVRERTAVHAPRTRPWHALSAQPRGGPDPGRRCRRAAEGAALAFRNRSSRAVRSAALGRRRRRRTVSRAAPDAERVSVSHPSVVRARVSTENHRPDADVVCPVW